MAVLLLLFIILVLVLSIPSVQTRLGKYATKRLNNDFKTNINIEKVGLQLNGDVELKGVLIKDFKQDTLISASEINTSILSFNNLYNGKLNFGDIDLEDLVFNVTTYKDEVDTNLDIFVARFDEDKPKKEKSDFLFSSSEVSIYNGIFRLTNENKEKAKILEFTDLNINATDFIINGSDVNARINTLVFTDSRGLKIKNMSTNFGYTLNQMTFDNLNIKTKNSIIKGELEFNYKREDLKEFEDKVQVTATLTEANILLDELNTFYNEFGNNQRARFSTKLSGTLNDLNTNQLKLNTNGNTKIYGDINFKNLFNSEEGNFAMDGKFNNLSTNYIDLKAMLPNVLGRSIPSIFDKFGNFRAKGDSYITASKIEADLEINTALGFIKSDLIITDVDNIDNASYRGNIILDEFQVGELLNDPKVGTMSSNLDVDGKGFDKETLNTQLQGDVYSIIYNDYEYQNIEVNGDYNQNKFNGKLVSNDKNLKLKFNGLADLSKAIYKLDFVANVDYANLKALNIYNRDEKSVFKGIVDMKMNARTVDDAVGSISFKNTTYTNENDTYTFKDFALNSSFKDNERSIKVNSPEIINGGITGNFKFKDLGALFENSAKSIYANYVPNIIEDNQYIDFNFKVYNKIAEVFFSDIKLGKNTFIKGRVETDEKAFRLTFKSPQIDYLDNFANNIELQIDNKNPLFNTYIEIDSVKTKHYSVSKFNLINVTLNDTLFMRSEFKGGKRNDDLYNLSFYHTINDQDLSVIGFKKSDVTFKNNKWYLNENKNKFNKISFDRDFNNFDIDQLVMRHNNEEISLSGVIKGKTQKDIKLNFKDVALEKIIPEVDSLSLTGNINGKLDIRQQNGSYLPNSTITIDNFKVNRQLLGSFNAKINGNESLTNYAVDAKIKGDKTNSFSAVGNILVVDKKPTIDVDLTFNKFNLKPLNPLLNRVLSNIRGDVFGTAKVTGNINKPSIDGQLTINGGGLKVNELNVDYAFKDNASVGLTNQSFLFNNIELTDIDYKSTARLNGRLSHINLSNWSLDLNLNTDRFLVLNTTQKDESLYYGTGFVGGTARIHGPTEALVIDVFAETKEGTVFKIPLNNNESFGDNSFVHFLSPEEKLAKAKGEEIILENSQGLQLNFELDVTQDAEIEIVIDKNSGGTIKGRGIGGLKVDINTNGKFQMFGDFIVWEGVYNFFYQGVAQKQFKVEPYTSTLAWNGDPLKALINIKAVYETRANPSPLLDNAINRTIPVSLEILLTDQLERPTIDYNFEFPNVSSTIKSELQYRLESKENRDNQALFLIATGSFSRGLNDINLTGTITERFNGILNSFFKDDDSKFQVGVNIEAGQKTLEYETENRVGVDVQAQISDKILFNGKVGVPVGGTSQTGIAGDAQVDFLLNEEGSLRAKVFNRENSIQNFGEKIGYTQGLGLTYSVDFDTFGELVDKIFKSKKKQKEEAEKKAKEDEEKKDERMPSDVGFKPKEQ